MAALKLIEIDWNLDPALSGRAKAVQIALVLMREAQVQTWQELHDLLAEGGEKADRMRRAVVRTKPGLLELLDAYEETLLGLRRPAGKRTSVTTTVIECPICHRWGYAPGGVQPPRSCQWTLRCGGNPVRHLAAEYTASLVS